MNNRYKETHNTWNKIAKLYKERLMSIDLYNDTYEQFCSLLPLLNANILEIGCGPGNITRQLLNLNSNLNILATDVSENMQKLAKENNAEIATQLLDYR